MQTSYTGPTGFFRRHFNGDYSLGRSYWVNTFLLQMFAPLLGVLVLPWLKDNFPARYGSAGVLVLTTVGVIAWAWAISGTWASANKHVSRGGLRFWAGAAKVGIVLGVVKMLGDLTGLSGSLHEHFDVAMGSQPGREILIQVRADGKSILLEGGINDGTADALRNALKIAPNVSTIVLHSNGGWVKEGVQIAAVIAEGGFDTYVEDLCVSACTIAFLAGKQRAAAPVARIGFHSFRPVGGGDAWNVDAAQSTYEAAGLSAEFISKVTRTPPDQVWYPPLNELLAERVLTRASFGGENATLATSLRTKEDLTTVLKEIRSFEALAIKYPQEFDQVIAQAWLKLQARAPDSEVLAAAKAQFSQALNKVLPIASDSSLLEHGALTLEQARAIGKESATACVEYVFPSRSDVNPSLFIPKSLQAREQEIMSKLIMESNDRYAVRISPKDAEGLVAEALGRLSEDEIQLLRDPSLRAASPVPACAAVLAYLKSINEGTSGEVARRMRGIYSATE